MEEQSAINRVISYAEGMTSGVQRTDNIFFCSQIAVEINQVFAAVMDKHYMCPNPGLELMAIASVHIGYTIFVISRPYWFAMRGKRDLPSLLPSTMRHQKYFTLSGQFIYANP